MIPYEELVIALQAWRAKKGLPIGQMSGALVPPPPAAMAPTTRTTSPPPGSGPNRSAPPAPPRGHAAAPPPPVATQVITQSNEAATDTYRPLADGDDEHAEMVEDPEYANEGDDFALAFQNLETEGESTAIGGPPGTRGESSADPTLPRSHRRNNDDW